MSNPPVRPVQGLVIVTLAAASASFCLNTVPPVAPALMAAWRIDAGQIGLLMSVFNITGLLLALPGSFVISRVGEYRSGLIALTAVMLGSLLGLMSTDFGVQVASRVVQGVGMAFVALLGPTLVGRLFPPERRGMAIGVFTTFMAFGQLVMFNVGPLAVQAWGWPSLWIGNAAYAAVFLAIWALALRSLRRAPHEVAADRAEPGPRLSEVLRHPQVLRLALAMALFMASFLTLMFFLPTYLAAERDLPLAEASTLSSLGGLVATAVSLLAGLVLDRFRSRHQVAAVCLVLVAAVSAAVVWTPTAWMLVPIVVLGIFPPLAGISILAATTEALPPVSRGLAVGMVMLGQNLGMVVGPLLFGAAIEAWGWTPALQGLAAVTLAAAAVLFPGRRSNPRR